MNFRKTSLLLEDPNKMYGRDRSISHTFGLKLEPANQGKLEAQGVIEESHKDIAQISLKNSEIPQNLNLNLNKKDKLSNKKLLFTDH